MSSEQKSAHPMNILRYFNRCLSTFYVDLFRNRVIHQNIPVVQPTKRLYTCGIIVLIMIFLTFISPQMCGLAQLMIQIYVLFNVNIACSDSIYLLSVQLSIQYSSYYKGFQLYTNCLFRYDGISNCFFGISNFTI